MDPLEWLTNRKRVATLEQQVKDIMGDKDLLIKLHEEQIKELQGHLNDRNVVIKTQSEALTEFGDRVKNLVGTIEDLRERFDLMFPAPVNVDKEEE